MERTWRAKIVAVLASAASVALCASLPTGQNQLDHVAVARASLRAGRVDLALRQASAAHSANPKDAAIQALLGDIAYRKADFEAAEFHYRSSVDLDRSRARAVWGLGRIEELNFRRGAARDLFAMAYRLDPRDPQIIRSYASVIPNRNAQTTVLKNYVAAGGDDPESALGQVQLIRKLGELETEALESPYRAYSLPMTPSFPDSSHPAGMVLRVSVNGGKPLRLIFDTGANSVMIRAKAAEKLGLEFVGASMVRGLGAGEPAKARIGLAQSLQIDDLRLRNCLIEVSDELPSGDADGVIGARMFQKFLIRFNAGERLLELLPFQDARPERSWHGHNREVAPGMEQFTRALQVGHLLLVKARVNKEGFGYFMLDTGAAFSSLSYDLARRDPQVVRSPTLIYGLSGRVNATRLNPVQFHFAREPITDAGVIAFDLRGLSRQEGVEISGLLGYPVLSRSVLTINYRDGLIDLN